LTVKQYGNYIKYLADPSEAVQLAAVRNHGECIRYIENPSEAVQLLAVKQNSGYIEYISNPSEAVKHEAYLANRLFPPVVYDCTNYIISKCKRVKHE
jgi:hypothetical protein